MSTNKRSHKKTTLPPHSTRSQKKTSVLPPQSVDSGSKSKISYEKNGRTDRIIDWLTNNVNDRIHLFSGNVQDASAERRRIRTGKTSKMYYYRKIAAAVFENEPEEKDGYAQDPERYARSVENHIQELKQKYQEFNKALGQAGTDLRAEEIKEDTDLRNLVDQLSVDFPYWERLHGFWRTLPNFNPYTLSAEHGQNLAALAQEFVHDSEHSFGVNEEDMGMDNVGDGAGLHLQPQSFWTTATVAPRLIADDLEISPISSVSYSGRLRASAVDDDTLIDTITTLLGKRLDRHISEQATKRIKVEAMQAKVNAELEMKKEKLKLEKLKLEKKKLKHQRRMLQMQYQREREREAHQLQMIVLASLAQSQQQLVWSRAVNAAGHACYSERG